MPQKEDIPHLLHLLDDESALVREKVESALRAFGPGIEKAVEPFLSQLNPNQSLIAQSLVLRIRKEYFHDSWYEWLEMEDEWAALKFAFTQLAYLEYGYAQPSLDDLLLELKADFLTWGKQVSISSLMDFLFLEKGFGPPSQAYYHPDNSNLVHVIQTREGIQISLSSIAILLAYELGLELYGLNVPGHFMVIGKEDDELRIYDCFNEGKSLDRSTFKRATRSLDLTEDNFRERRALPHEVILRVLRNIINARFKLRGRQPKDPYVKLLEQLVGELKKREMLR